MLVEVKCNSIGNSYCEIQMLSITALFTFESARQFVLHFQRKFTEKIQFCVNEIKCIQLAEIQSE